MVDVRPPVVMSALTPERVAGAEFGNSFRGFDPTQVRGFLARVAAELDALLERERELHERVAELEQRLAEATTAGNQTLDEHQLTELLGAETARVLEAARDAASVLRANAEEQAVATVAAAEAEAAQLRAQAEALLDERAQTAEAEATRLLEDAERDAARLREEAEAVRWEAQREGDEHRAMARDEGRRMVAEARAVRERILTDMARRRNQARQQLERLRAGRERLLDAIEVVRRAIDGASGELNDAVVEAKLAGERAARQVDLDAVPPISDLDAEVELAKDAGLIDVEALEREVAGAVELADEEPEVEAEPAGAAVADRPAEGSETVRPTDAEADADLDTGAPPDEPGSAIAESTDAVQRIDVESTDEVQRTGAPQRIDVDSTEGLSDVATGPAADAEQAADDQPVPSDPSDADIQAEAEPLVPPARPARRQGFSHAVDDLFSRWKHEEGDHLDFGTGAEAAVVATGAEAGSPQGSAARSADAGHAEPTDLPMADEAESNGSIGARPAADVPDGAAAVARQTRDAVLAGIARDLTRHLKLALSDEQNLVLEDQRDGRAARQPKRAVADLVEELERSDRFDQAARRELIGALEAGWGAIPIGGGEGPDPRLLDPVVDEVCRLLTAPLRDRLRRALEDAGDSNTAAERVRNLYRETRNEQAASLAEHGALTAFAVGQYAAAGQLPSDGDVRVRWAFDGCVPDCYDNFLAGGLLLGTAFPTEHRHPPAFPGCRCLLVVESRVESRVESIGADASSDERVPRGH